MRIKGLGFVGLAVWAMACGGDDPPPTPPGTQSFKVGGTLSGLAGNLTLQLNGVQNLSRSENGPFAFAEPVADGSNYRVSITASPEEQECTLQGDTGQVNGADVTSVQVSCAARTYTVGGTVTGLTGTLQLRLGGAESLSLTANGPFAFQKRHAKGDAYTVTIDTQPQGHRCALTGESGTVAGNVTTVQVRCTPWFAFTSFQNASRVIGQNDFTSNSANQGGAAGPNTLNGPWGNASFVGGTLYVSDLDSNRILGFSGLPTQNGAAASFVLGQPDFTSTAAGSGRGGLSSMEGTSSDGTRLAVADKGNSRVLLYNTLPTNSNARPDLVIGQPDFDTTALQCGASSLGLPEDVFMGHGKLLVADSANNRILIWNTLPTTSGQPADLVLGQVSFTTCAGNDVDGDGVRDLTATASTLLSPAGLWTDGTRLLVADTGNNRVLVWNQFPTTNGQPAESVLGQPDLTTRTSGLAAAKLNAPYIVNSTGQQIFVAEYQNNRVLVWNQFPAAPGAAADTVLGQQDFTSNRRFDPPNGTLPSARSLYQPSGILLAAPYLVVSDYGNNRLLLFESP
ncbi:NHL repeat-containing protein [Stigmatella sp. ncwal1]|uniref:NHL repeat-containing protein n=1 Tax=Stigmatella ashevillensis TaxID=2995309 RepID=A0ABT5DI28_9BACT|nr:NHL repeat-containing protein [Stigmatella ashevillena]MDC0713224.1 NHL repeat-containing protein [Stigmatella ashevillena]